MLDTDQKRSYLSISLWGKLDKDKVLVVHLTSGFEKDC